MVKFLLDNGADPTCTSNVANTSALCCALSHSSNMTFELLCDSLFEKDKDADLATHLKLSEWEVSFLYKSGQRLDKDRLRVLRSWKKYWKKSGNSASCSTLLPIVEYLLDIPLGFYMYISQAMQGNYQQLVKMMLRVLRHHTRQVDSSLIRQVVHLCGLSQTVLQECQLPGSFSFCLW